MTPPDSGEMCSWYVGGDRAVRCGLHFGHHGQHEPKKPDWISLPLSLAQRILAALEGSQWMGVGSGGLRTLAAELRAHLPKESK